MAYSRFGFDRCSEKQLREMNRMKDWEKHLAIGVLSVVIILLLIVIGILYYENHTLILRNIEITEQIRENSIEREKCELFNEFLRNRYGDEEKNIITIKGGKDGK